MIIFSKKFYFIILISIVFIIQGYTKEIDIKNIEIPLKKRVAGKMLKLNSPCVRSEFFMTVYVVAFYLEKPEFDFEKMIQSEQIKQLVVYFKTDLVSADRFKDGFIAALEKTNPSKLVKKHTKNIEKFLSVFDKGMIADQVSVTTYIPGSGLSVRYLDDKPVKIAGKEFAQMVFRANFADEHLKKACRFR